MKWLAQVRNKLYPELVPHVGAGQELVAHADRLHSHFRGIAEQIIECATSETSVHNPVGSDSEILVGMMQVGPRQDFINQFEQMVLRQA